MLKWDKKQTKNEIATTCLPSTTCQPFNFVHQFNHIIYLKKASCWGRWQLWTTIKMRQISVCWQPSSHPPILTWSIDTLEIKQEHIVPIKYGNNQMISLKQHWKVCGYRKCGHNWFGRTWRIMFVNFYHHGGVKGIITHVLSNTMHGWKHRHINKPH